MSSVLKVIVENGELNNITDVAVAKILVLSAFESERNNVENRRFRRDINMCEDVEDIQKIIYNAYLKRIGQQVIK